MMHYQNISRFSGAGAPTRKKGKKLRGRPFIAGVKAFNYAEPELVRSSSYDVPYAVQQTIDASGLKWDGASPEQLEFMKKVYNINVKRSSARGTFVADVPESDLSTVEGRFKLRANAAGSCIKMLKNVREAIEEAGADATIGLVSAYRSASHQFKLWQDYFPGYYADTEAQRKKKDGGEHGDEAAQYLASYIRVRIATPGFSNHNNGLAVDLRNVQDGKTYRNKTRKKYTDAWRTTWLWDWLEANAATYKFYQNTHIDEPWHWEYRETAS
ncbi:M15 family metallopeptidase [Sinomicrobium weinanense]|uniref:D-alanyl-D-alanine carboxypeptidase family protein n=1 Tax=Sinomicrobium weinanense TaxID=2842200 RepID=A0A926Q1H4_9FLAO|nr:M15 family metallopeptidase [Sinomicrobium weinanense]MBC9794799.1 D-alanyl-D-alanine carboxypeptidase family protein [Sinomicrobium weinanense]MBU3125058.1 M15 family metallopeptidase [Sinomicrobium weinanense]